MQHVSYRGHQCEAAVCSFFALCNALDLLSSLKRGRGSVNPDDLEAAVSTHFQLRLLAYGTDRCQPKMHWALRHSQHLCRRGPVHTCQTLQTCQPRKGGPPAEKWWLQKCL